MNDKNLYQLALETSSSYNQFTEEQFNKLLKEDEQFKRAFSNSIKTSNPDLNIEEAVNNIVINTEKPESQLPKRVVQYIKDQNKNVNFSYDEIDKLYTGQTYHGKKISSVEDYVAMQNAHSGNTWSIEDPNKATKLDEFEVGISKEEVEAAKDIKEKRELEKAKEDKLKSFFPLSLTGALADGKDVSGDANLINVAAQNQDGDTDLDLEESESNLVQYLNNIMPGGLKFRRGQNRLNEDWNKNKIYAFKTGPGTGYLADATDIEINLKASPQEIQQQLIDIVKKEGLDLEQLEANINKYNTVRSDFTRFNDDPLNATTEIILDEDRLAVNSSLKNLFDIGEDKIVDINNEVANISFKPYTETKTNYAGAGEVGSYKFDTYNTTYTVYPHKKELEEATALLSSQNKRLGLPEPTKEQIEAKAREIIKDDKLRQARTIRYENYIEGDLDNIEGLSDKEIDRLKTEAKKQQNDALFRIDKKRDLMSIYLNEVDAMGMNFDNTGEFKGYKTQMGDNSGMFYSQKLDQFINDKTIAYEIKPGESYYESEDGRKIPQWLYDGSLKEKERFVFLADEIKKVQSDLDNDIADLKSADQRFNIVRKNYNDFAKFGTMFGLATINLLASTAKGLLDITPQGIALRVMSQTLGFDNPLDQAMVALKGWDEDVRDNFKEDVQFGEINSLKDIGNYTYQSIATQAPLIISMIATGGLSGTVAKGAGLTSQGIMRVQNISSAAMVGLSSYAGKMQDMDYEEFRTGKDLYSDAEILLKSIGYGTTEGAFSYFSTAPILNKGLGKVTGLSDDILETQLREGFRSEMKYQIRKDIMPETLGEMWFEGLTTGTQNLIDGRPFMENMSETLVSSGFWGAGMSGIPSLYVAGTKNFAHNRELNIINENTRKANELRRQNTSLVTEMDGMTRQSKWEDLNKQVELNNKLIDQHDAKSLEAQKVVEENVIEEGMLPDAAKNFIKGQSNLADLRIEANRISNDNTKSKKQKEQELQLIGDVYNQAKQGMERFNDTKTFGSLYGSLTMAAAGKDIKDADHIKYNKVNAEAKQNLIKDNNSKKTPNPDYIPTASEIANEADNILIGEQIDKQVNKDRKQSKRLGHNFIDFESKEQAAEQISTAYDNAIELETNNSAKENLIANRDEVVSKIKKGTLNGGSLTPANGGFFLDFVVKDNMSNNKRFTSALHENTHSITRKILKENPEAFKNLGDQIVKYLVFTGQESALAEMNMSNANLRVDGEIDYDEVISSFVELIASDKVDLNKMDNFKGIMGKLLNDGLMNATDGSYNIEFKGQKDILEFFMGFSKKLANGDLTIADIDLAKDRFSPVSKGKIIKLSEKQVQQRIAASELKKSEARSTSKNDLTLYQETNKIFNSKESIRDKGMAIGELWKRVVRSRVSKGYKLGSQFLQPTTWDGWDSETMNDLMSDMATGGSGVPGLVKSYSNRSAKFKDMSLEAWINSKLNQRITGYLPDNLVSGDMSIDSETARQIEDVKAGRFDEDLDQSKDSEGRELKKFEELSIVTPELFDNIRKILTDKLKKTAITKGFKQDVVNKDIQSAIEKEITKVIRAEMGPISKNVLGFAPKQYSDFIVDNMDTIIGAMPIDIVKQKAKSKDWANIFKLKEIGREDIKKVENGKTTYYRKQIFKVEKPNVNDFKKYFTRAGYTTLIARQKSLVQPIAKELAKTELFKLKQDSDFINELSDRTGMTAEQVSGMYIDNVLDNMQDVLDQTAGEQRSRDVIKFSETLANSNGDSRQTFIDGMRSSTFKSMLASNLANVDYLNKNKKSTALKSTIQEYFYPANKFFIDLSDGDLTKIANDFGGTAKPTFQKQLEAEAKKLNEIELSEVISEAIIGQIDNPADYKALELSLGINEVNYDLKSVDSINIGRKMALKLAIKVGRQKFLRLYAPSLSGPAGLAGIVVDKPTGLEIKDSDVSSILPTGKKSRVSLFRNKQDLIDNILNAKDSKGNLLVKDSKGDYGKVTKEGNYDGRVDKKNWYFSNKWESLDGDTKAQLEFVNEIMKEGEVNKNILRDTVQELAGKITPAEARWFVAVNSANMNGAIKASASLIGYPTLNKEQLQKSLNLKSNDPYVLEHMTPAKYMALLTYKYLLDPTAKSKKDFNDELNNFHTIILPDGLDEILRAEGKQSSMGLKHRIGDDPFLTRYDEILKVMELTKTDGSTVGKTTVNYSETNNSKATQKIDAELINSSKVKLSEENQNTGISLIEAEILDKALSIARDPNAPVKKIRVFDFDDTLARSNSLVFYKMPDGTEGKLDAATFAKEGDRILSEGGVFDFSDFNIVRDGKPGPLLDVAKKIQETRGTDDVFVLTARAPESQQAVKQFLDEVGLNIPLENIVGLGNSSPLAKSGWIVDRAAEGYNDFYFADDHLKNVDAVDRALSVVDVKSKTQQAKVKFSETVDQVMNDIIYQKTGIESFKEFSDVRAKAEGRGKRSFDLIPPSAEDFGGLMYKLLGKGKDGDAQWEWIQENLIRPYNRGVNDLTITQNNMSADFKALKNSLTGIPKNLKKKAFGGFTFEDIVRVAAWDKQGINVDGLSKKDLKEIRSFLNENKELDSFSDQLIAITKTDGYHYPGKNWLAGTITTDFREGLRTGTRSRYLKQWNDNIDQAFSNKNLNKIEAAFGSKYREALEDSIRRMKTGTNRGAAMGRLESRVLDYVNNSIGTVMFLNSRSAILQTISSVNFLNWKDNNPLKAGKAFANQPQYWKDFTMLMNSDYLVDRRNGLKINVSESEIAEAAKTSKNKAKAAIGTILSKGFVFTQFADSFAIASGGATFYRNRLNTYKKQGLSQSEAEAKAFEDFKATSEESQQSSDPSKISQQQSSTLGKILLAFANTPSQYARIMKKASLDLVNGRGDWKSNISKIVYYGAIQNIIFTTLQSALFSEMFEDDEESEEFKEQQVKELMDKKTRVNGKLVPKYTREQALKEVTQDDNSKYYKSANSMVDNILRGMGIGGTVVSTIKNIGIDIYERSNKKRPEYADVAFKLLDVAPPIDIKVSKFRQGMTTWDYNRKNPEAKDPFAFNNPAYEASAKVIASTTNIPLDRLYQKVVNIKGALDDENKTWQRVAMALGWPLWQLESDKQSTERRKEEKEKREEANTPRYSYKKIMNQTEQAAFNIKQKEKKYFKLNKKEQVKKLDSLGLTKKEIRGLRLEKDRVKKLLDLMDKK